MLIVLRYLFCFLVLSLVSYIASADIFIPDLEDALSNKDWERFINVLEQSASNRDIASMTEIDKEAPIASGFNFGVEIARPDLAPEYTEIGASWIGVGLVHWEFVEQNPPVGEVHTYNWLMLDYLVNHWQSHGFENVHIVISPRCSWAAVSEPNGPESATPIKEEYLDDFGLLMRAIVERYDGDGIDDSPHLITPVKYYEIGQEMQHSYYWEGTLEEYLKLLAIAYAAVKFADEESKVILSGINLGELFDDCPSPEVLAFRIANLNPELAAAFQFIVAMLTFDQWFDVIEFHYNYDYKGGHGIVNWLREQMAENGYNKPIWVGDAAAGPMVDSVTRTPEEADELYDKLSNPKNPEHEETVIWFEREQALALVKKLVIAMELDLEGVIISNLTDWPGYPGGRSWEFQGLRRLDGSARPAFTTYVNTVSSIGAMTEVERLSTSSESVYAFQLTNNERTIYVLWCAAEPKYWDLYVEASSVLVSSPVPGEIEVEEIQIIDGHLHLLLTEVPLLVEPVMD